MKFNFILLISILVLAICSELVICGKKNYESCSRNDECDSKYCRKSVCTQRKCRSDKTCLNAGLSDHYCKKRGLKIFSSEW